MDRHLVRLLAHRRDLVVDLMVWKRRYGLRLVDLEQERRVRRRAVRWAKELGIPRDATTRWFALILAECKRQALRGTPRRPRGLRAGARA